MVYIRVQVSTVHRHLRYFMGWRSSPK